MGKEKYYVSTVSLEALCPLEDFVMAKLHWLWITLLLTDVHDTHGLEEGSQWQSEIHLEWSNVSKIPIAILPSLVASLEKATVK